MISRRTIRRILYSLLTFFASITITFILIHNIPGDVVETWAYELVQNLGVSIEDARSMVISYMGYQADKPMHLQYLEYVGNLLRGNLGYSGTFRMPVNGIVVHALPWTLLILSISLAVSFAVGSLLGILIAWRRGTILDPIVSAYAAITDATPDFVTAVILFVVLAVQLRLFPLKGAYDASLTAGFNIPFILSVLHHAALPVMAYVVEHIGMWALYMKSSAVGVLEEDYVRAAVAKGLKDRRIMMSYVGRTAILPLVAILSIQLGAMLGGNIIIERVFTYPGIGYFFAEAITRRDFGLMQGLFFLTISGVIVANLIVDLVYPKLDPRVRGE